LSVRWSSWCAFLLVAVTPTVAWAEVMDKEPAPVEIWAWAICGGAGAALAWNLRAWFGALATAALARFFITLWLELTDPFVQRDRVNRYGSDREIRDAAGATQVS
jgi:hypothetical protein